MTGSRRLFVAVDVDAAACRTIARAIDFLSARADEAGASVRWTPAHNLHLTMRFIGATDESALGRIRNVMGETISVDAFTIDICGIGTFPSSGAPRVIWAGISRGADRLKTVAREVEARLRVAGCVPEDRPFRAHLTLGRVRPGPPRQMKAARRILAGVELDAVRVAVDHVTLYESRMSPKGSTYHQLLRTSLQT